MILEFIKEYRNWKREHKTEVQQAKLRHEAMKTPLNYTILDQMFQTWVKNTNRDMIMEIKGADFTVKCYYDNNGNYQRKTRIEQIMENYNNGK